MALSVKAFSLGTARGLNKPAFTYMRGWGEVLDIPLLMFVIEGGDAPIVVDTGADPARGSSLHGIPIDQEPHEHPLAVMRSLGIDSRDVPVVVNTHLHWDHSSNNHLFPNAQVVVQRAEVEFARRPVRWHARSFEANFDVPASWRNSEDRVRQVDGDVELAPGVSVVTLPGHTPGSQGVLVETAGGRYLIAGDAVYLYENWEGDATAAHVPSALFTDLVAFERTYDRIEALGAEVIPSHDWKVLERGVFA